MMSFQRIEPIEKSGTGNTVKLDQITCQMLVYHDRSIPRNAYSAITSRNSLQVRIYVTSSLWMA